TGLAHVEAAGSAIIRQVGKQSSERAGQYGKRPWGRCPEAGRIVRRQDYMAEHSEPSADRSLMIGERIVSDSEARVVFLPARIRSHGVFDVREQVSGPRSIEICDGIQLVVLLNRIRHKFPPQP